MLMEHLIVGVLLFTPLLALMPTSLLFFCFSLGCQLTVVIVRSLLACLIHLLICNPCIPLVLRLFIPSLFPGTLLNSYDHFAQIFSGVIAVSALRESSGTLVVNGKGKRQIRVWHYKMQSIPQDMQFLLKDPFLYCLKRLWQIKSTSIAGIPFGKVIGLKP